VRYSPRRDSPTKTRSPARRPPRRGGHPTSLQRSLGCQHGQRFHAVTLRTRGLRALAAEDSTWRAAATLCLRASNRRETVGSSAALGAGCRACLASTKAAALRPRYRDNVPNLPDRWLRQSTSGPVDVRCPWRRLAANPGKAASRVTATCEKWLALSERFDLDLLRYFKPSMMGRQISKKTTSGQFISAASKPDAPFLATS
jgi:hypothetical protein